MFDVGLELGIEFKNLRFGKRSSAHYSQKAVGFDVHFKPVPKDEEIDNVRKDTEFGEEKDR